MERQLLAFLMPLFLTPVTTVAQVNAGDSVMEHAQGRRLTVGGYGEVAYTRNFYSDNQYSTAILRSIATTRQTGASTFPIR